MAKTFTINQRNDGMEWSQEMPNTAVTGHPYLDHIAALALFNKTGSGKVLKVKQIAITPYSSINVSTPSQFEFYRITALTGGESLTASKLDSNNANLPSQVSLVKYPATVTTSGATVARRSALPLQNMTRALGSLASARGSHSKLGNGQVFRWMDDATAQTQKMTLREGEGFCVRPGAGNNSNPTEWMVSMWIRVVSTGACYVVSDRVYNSELATLAILNGSGSGIVLEVFNVEVYEAGTDEPTLFSVEGIDGADLDTCGTTLTPLGHDSVDSLSASILAIKNARVKSGGANDGVLIAVPRRKAMAGVSQQAGGVATVPRGITPNWIVTFHEGFEMVIREGKGIALMQRTPGKIGRFEVQITFTEDSALGSAVFPNVGDVDQGTAYGPNGSDYTGTLEQPAEADVKTGVQYGAGGTEFTGEYVGGGGGNIFILPD